MSAASIDRPKSPRNSRNPVSARKVSPSAGRSARPAPAQASSSPRAGSKVKTKATPLGIFTFRLVFFGLVFGATHCMSQMFGQLELTNMQCARRVTIARARQARQETASLRAEVNDLESPGRIDMWASSHGFSISKIDGAADHLGGTVPMLAELDRNKDADRESGHPVHLASTLMASRLSVDDDAKSENNSTSNLPNANPAADTKAGVDAYNRRLNRLRARRESSGPQVE